MYFIAITDWSFKSIYVVRISKISGFFNKFPFGIIVMNNLDIVKLIGVQVKKQWL